MSPNEEFIYLFTAHHNRLLNYIMTLVPNRLDAEDLLQETSIVLFQKFSQYRAGSSFFAWAARIAYNKVQNLRRSAVIPAVLLDEAVLEALSTEAIEDEETCEWSDALRDALQGCMLKLSSADRELVTRRYMVGTSGKTLSAELQRPANSICKSLGRIRITLLNCVERKMSVTGGVR